MLNAENMKGQYKIKKLLITPVNITFSHITDAFKILSSITLGTGSEAWPHLFINPLVMRTAKEDTTYNTKEFPLIGAIIKILYQIFLDGYILKKAQKNEVKRP